MMTAGKAMNSYQLVGIDFATKFRAYMRKFSGIKILY